MIFAVVAGSLMGPTMVMAAGVASVSSYHWACTTHFGSHEGLWFNASTTVINLLPHGVDIPAPGLKYTKDEEFDWLYGNSPDISADQQQRLQEAVRSLKHCFAFELSDLTGYTGPCGNFKIQLTHDRAIYEKPRRLSPLELREAQKAVKDLLDAGFIEVCPINGKYACNMVIAAKKDENGVWCKIRCCQDYRKVNKDTKREEHGLPHPDDVFSQLQGSTIFTKLDLRSGFYQLWIDEEDRDKTAFWCDRVLYRFKRMPFGLKCAPIVFQRVVDQCLAAGGCSEFAIGFIDDIIIHSKDAEQHIEHVKQVLAALNAHGLKVHPQKSVFGAESVEYLGHTISKYGQSPHEAKTKAIRDMPPPTNVSEVRSVHGLLSYYRCYCENFSAKAAPLTELTKKNAHWQWGPEQQAALDILKGELCQPGKALRRLDYSKPIFLHTDWSKRGIGAVIGQLDETDLDEHGKPKEYMCACISRSLNTAEKNYEASKGEMLAAVWAIKTFRHYLHGVRFHLITDHSALRWLIDTPHTGGQYARWAMILQEYDFEVVHRAGQIHQNADALSRQPLPSDEDTTGARLDDDSAHVHACSAILASRPTTDSLGIRGGGGHAALAVMADALHEASCSNPEYVQSWAAAATVQSRLRANASFIDRFAPSNFSVFQGHNPALLDHGEQELWADEPESATTREKLHRKAATWVRTAMAAPEGRPSGGSPQHPIKLAGEGADHFGVRATTALDTQVIAPQFFANTPAGITLYEPFGGLCAGLEMVLANGIPVRRYLYSDISKACQLVAQHRVTQLAARYPSLFTIDAAEGMFCLPQDVRQITTRHLVDAGALDGSQWLVVAGWECQDLSAAGSGEGLQGKRSNTFYDLLRIVGSLQQLQSRKPPAYLLENTYMKHKKGKVLRRDYPRICTAIGQPITIDAAQCDSYAHRLRCFWTNLADTTLLAQVFSRAVRRTPGLHVDSILDEGRVTAPVHRTERCGWEGWYVCNKGTHANPGMRCVLPTLMATEGSYSFRPGKPGSIFRGDDPLLLAEPSEPNPDERERALGYRTGTTAAPGVTDAQRHRITGGCMDANTLKAILAISMYLDRHQARAPCTATASCAAATCNSCGAGQLPVPFNASMEGWAQEYMLAAATSAADAGAGEIWEDQAALQYLQHRIMPTGVSDAEKRRLQRCAERYKLQSHVLYRCMADGTVRVVPAPDQRAKLVQETHDQLGHLGEKRTEQLLRLKFWWRGLQTDVEQCVSTCEPCARAKVAFNQRQPELQPLPIMGLFYRWGVDLAGPFKETPRGNQYAMIAIEHWSKTVVVVPIKSKDAVTTAYAFLHHVLARFGAPAVVLADQGNEWEAQFRQLCTDAFIDLRSNSANRPSTNGLTERAVQTLKSALAKYCLVNESADDWDEHCAWLALGYNCSPQASTRLAPYHILYGRVPAIPSSLQGELMKAHVDFDSNDQIAVVADVLQRADICRRLCPTIDENLANAQQRDSQRYAHVRSGTYIPKPKPLQVGDYVYVKYHEPKSTLQMDTMPVILKVHKLSEHGVVTLIGKCGGTIKVHVSHCARCSLPNIDPVINPSLRTIGRNVACTKCGSKGQAAQMLLCDGCGDAWHNMCLPRPLPAITPEEEVWICPGCEASGLTPSQAAAQRASEAPEPRLPETMVFPSAAQRRYQEQCKALDGRVVCKVFNDPDTGRKAKFWGTVHYRGILARPHYFEVTYTDGDSETMALAALKRILQPPGTKIPVAARPVPESGHATRSSARRARGVAAVACVVSGSTPAELLEDGMPGDWQVGDKQRALDASTAYLRHLAPRSEVTSQAVESLAAAVDLFSCLSVLDPFGEGLAVATALAALGVRTSVGMRDKPYLHNALSPSFYQQVLEQQGAIEAIVTAPWPPLLDVALPLAAGYATRMVCCHVPLDYVCNAHPVRRAWLAQFRTDGRLFFVHPRDPTAVEREVSSGVWLVIFTTPAGAKSALRASGPWSTVL
ncbi:MAG: reverse transcriptase domain-containing protein [Minisyncoccia bacterium]